MANTAALLANYLSTNADINFFTQQMVYWGNQQEANARKLEKMQKYETKWENAVDSALSNREALSCGNVYVESNNQTQELAESYAHAKVEEYDYETLLDLQEKDIEYDTMKTMYDTLLVDNVTDKSFKII